MVPVRRGDSTLTQTSESSEMVLLAVGEDSLQPVLTEVPDALLDRVVLLQNELRPANWLSRYGASRAKPTSCIVWFEKKGDRPPVVVLPSVLYGPCAGIMSEVFAELDLPCRRVLTEKEHLHQLTLKNLYILGLNFSGLRGAGRAGQLLDDPDFACLVAELIDLEEAGLRYHGINEALDRDRLQSDLRDAIVADEDHACAGRSAPARLQRTLSWAGAWKMQLPICSSIAQQDKK